LNSDVLLNDIHLFQHLDQVHSMRWFRLWGIYNWLKAYLKLNFQPTIALNLAKSAYKTHFQPNKIL